MTEHETIITEDVPVESQVRMLLFNLLEGLGTLDALENTLSPGNVGADLTETTTPAVSRLAEFLTDVKEDTHRYVTGEGLQNAYIGKVFLYFLAALALTHDSRITRGSQHAVLQVPLNSFSEYYREIDQAEQEEVTQQLDDWIVALNRIQSADSELSDIVKLNELRNRFSSTADQLERAMNR